MTPRVQAILVTGAAGFLGRAVMEQLASLGLAATGLTRRALPAMQQVADYTDTPAAEVIIHLAEESDRALVNQDGDSYADKSASVVRTLVSRADRVIYASSGMVYGDDSDAPFTTTMRVIGTDTYSRSKIRNETIALDAGGTALRLSNLFGRGMSDRNVVSDIARQIGALGPLRVRDDTPIRDFLCVRDAANAIALVAAAQCPGVLNIGSGVGTSIRNLAEIALASTGQQGRKIVASQPSSRRSVNILDVAETQRRIGWAPTPTAADQLGTFFRIGASLGQ